MKIVFQFLVALIVLSGCSGAPFTGLYSTGADGGQTVPDSAPPVGTGGSTGSGGQASSGGHTASGGHTTSSGGAEATDDAGAGGSSGGATESGGSDGGCDLVTHTDGVGHTWQDCASLGTLGPTESARACLTWCAANNCLGGTCSGASPPNWFGCVGRAYFFAETTVNGVEIGWGQEINEVIRMDPNTQSCTVIGSWE